MQLNPATYPVSAAFDELIDAHGVPRPAARALFDYLSKLDPTTLKERRASVDAAIMTMGITFTIYSEGENIDRAWPFDIIPRVIARDEWRRIEAGLKQRLTALNCFINDIYNESWQAHATLGCSAWAMRPSLACGHIYVAPIWCETRTAPSTCSRTTFGSPRGCPTCWKTGC
jgi:hypothetical protein